MRNLSPEVLKAVGKSILQTLLVLVLFLDFFLLYTKFVGSSLEALLQHIGTEFDWKTICQDARPSEWGQFCKDLDQRRAEFSPVSAIACSLVILTVLIYILVLCSELLFELEERSQLFLNWWRNTVTVSIQAPIGG